MEGKNKIFYITFGCKVNQAETERLQTGFSAAGYPTADLPEEADIFLVNSCTVTASSDKKLRQELSRLRQKYPGSILMLTGCFPQASPEAAARLPADIITGSSSKMELIPLLQKYQESLAGAPVTPISGKQFAVRGFTGETPFEQMPFPAPLSSKRHTRGFLKIQDGCRQFCTYCIIPKARGPIRSMPLEHVQREALSYAAAGYRELVLTGINLFFYGVDLPQKPRLTEAIRICCQTPGIRRVRLGSLEPECITSEDIRRISPLENLCPQFHLSLQSGCNRTLKEMNRRYTAGEYALLVQKLREAFPMCAVTTDVMVGFPGETEDDFEQSLRFIEKIGFADMHIFPYSPRPGTPASKRADQIPAAIKKRRAALLADLAADLRKKHLQRQIGRRLPILFERENSPLFHQGRAPDHTLVKIPAKTGEKSLRGDIFYVIIEGMDQDGCVGRLDSSLSV